MRPFLTPLRTTMLAPVHPGLVIKAGLEGRHMTIEEFANRCELSFDSAQQIISGGKNLDNDLIQKMMPIFGDDIDLIVGAKYRFEYYQKYHRRPEYIPS